MPTAAEQFHAGKLTEAIALAIDAVRSAPADRTKRWLLAELLAFSGDLERADKHFEMLMNQPDAPDVLQATLCRQLLRAETARREVFTQGRLPEFIGIPPEHVNLTLQAFVSLRDKNAEQAQEFLLKADDARPDVKGVCNGEPFAMFRDLDDLTAGVFEVLTSNGNYYWVPFESVESLEFRAPTRPRDLLWRSVRMIVKDGPDGEVYMPTLFAGSHSEASDATRMGRETSYTESLPIRGKGLREFLLGDSTRTIMELTDVTFGV